MFAIYFVNWIYNILPWHNGFNYIIKQLWTEGILSRKQLLLQQ